MKKTGLLICFILAIQMLNAQAFVNLGLGMSLSKGNLTKLQNSYSSYKTHIRNIFPNDPFEDNGNWKNTQFVPHFAVQAGFSGDDFYTAFAWHTASFKQELELKRQSGYGRKFVWLENRNELMIDIGYGSKKVNVFGTIGANFGNHTMASYQIYPDGTLSIGNEFTFNGLYKGFDAGMNYGLGFQYKFNKRINAEMRFYLSSDKLIGEPDEFVAYADNSFSRVPGTNQLPQDYTKPQTLDNEVLVGVRRTYLQFTLSYNILPKL